MTEMQSLKLAMRAYAWQHPLKAAMILCLVALFVVDTGMSVLNGYRRAGGDFQLTAFGFAAIMFAVAGLATYMPVAAKRETGWRKLGFWLVSLPLFLITQSNGWAVMGVTLADGHIKREVKATSRNVTADTLAKKRIELDKIGTVRPVATIAAERALECKRTSRRYPDGKGPKCTKLIAEEETAKRARTLEDDIKNETANLQAAPKVAGGNIDIAVLQALVNATAERWKGAPLTDAEKFTHEDTYFAFSILLVAVIGFFANFGPAMLLPAPQAGDAPFEMPMPAPYAFDPAQLPAPPKHLALTDGGDVPPSHQSPSQAPSSPPALPPGPHLEAPAASSPTNVIHVNNGSGSPAQNLPARVAANRRAHVRRA